MTSSRRLLLPLAACLVVLLSPIAATAQSACPLPGAVAWLPMNGTPANLVGSDGILSGGTSFVGGIVGQALSLDGSGRVALTVGTATPLLTVEAWIKPIGVQTLNAVIASQAGSYSLETTRALVVDAGNANPDSDFRFDASQGGYVFNLKTTGLISGSYELRVTVGDGAKRYSVPLQIR